MLFLLRLTEEFMYVFDSPKDGSIKDSERMGRTDAEKPPIGLDEVKMHEPIPKDMEYFWPLNDNKQNYKYSCMIQSHSMHQKMETTQISFLVAFKIIKWQRKW